ncbi:zf-TFIIB domain-containing protein [Geotalea sp. SG265]|uniref:zf-TFIIB domain-containing protein n=1 Tax=Geotalea sp. SG265 TaxID=2922867 RepID=UPI001FAE7909|nr:zf-TFIIB domain-containing protein [Geotalea sp. SG265]
MANCSNCSAPLPPGSITCDYCGSRNDVDLKGINYYTTNEPESERICPRCNKPLRTIDLKVGGTFLVERCEQCLGLFFDPGELEALLQATVTNVFTIDRARLDALSAARRADEYGITYVKCPVCATMMNRVNFGAKSGVVIDRCREHGIWLDGGELRQLAEWMKAGGKLLDQERQEEQKKKEAEEERQRRKEEINSAATTGSYPDYTNYGTYTLEDDLFELLKKAVIFFTR